MMELFDDLKIRCRSCGSMIRLDKNSFDFETYSYDHGENAMGEEIEYVIQDEVECDCGNTISFRISGFEYPVGAFDYESNEIVGGDFVEKPHMGIVYYAEDFDLYLLQCQQAGGARQPGVLFSYSRLSYNGREIGLTRLLMD